MTAADRKDGWRLYSASVFQYKGAFKQEKILIMKLSEHPHFPQAVSQPALQHSKKTIISYHQNQE